MKRQNPVDSDDDDDDVVTPLRPSSCDCCRGVREKWGHVAGGFTTLRRSHGTVAKLYAAGSERSTEFYYREVARLTDLAGIAGVVPMLGYCNDCRIIFLPALGQDLYDYRTDTYTSLRILRRLAEILCAVHAADVVHCDLKPENVMITELGGGCLEVTLIDWNSGVRLSSPGALQSIVPMTPATRPPESLDCGMPLSGRAVDVWAFGVLTYETLTDRVSLFRDGRLGVDMEEFLSADSADRWAARDKLPRGASLLLDWILKRDPGARPNMIDIARHLDVLIRLHEPAAAAAASSPPSLDGILQMVPAAAEHLADGTAACLTQMESWSWVRLASTDYSTVWAAAAESARRYAVKRYANRDSQSDRRDFYNELNFLNRLLFSRWVISPVSYCERCLLFTFPYYPHTLARRATSLTAAQRRTALGSVARAMRDAHSAGVVHCDLKQSNVLLNDDVSSVVLIDWNSARYANALRNESEIFCSRGHQSPEALLDHRADWGTPHDVWSFGVCCYEVVRGFAEGSMWAAQVRNRGARQYAIIRAFLEDPKRWDGVDGEMAWVRPVLDATLRLVPSERASAQSIVERWFSSSS